MRRAVVALAVLLSALFLTGLSGEARANVNDDVELFGLFHDPLAAHGRWIHLKQHGWSWTPRHVPHGWRPYSIGRWVITDYDWTWVSDEPWGWATDHYGRWFFEPSYGWVWVPGPIWGPAWVAWRRGGGFFNSGLAGHQASRLARRFPLSRDGTGATAGGRWVRTRC